MEAGSFFLSPGGATKKLRGKESVDFRERNCARSGGPLRASGCICIVQRFF